MRPLEIHGETSEAVHGALVSAFKVNQLERLVVEFDADMANEIAWQHDIKQVGFEVLRQAQRSGVLAQFLLAVQHARPNREDIAALFIVIARSEKVIRGEQATTAKLWGHSLERIVNRAPRFVDPVVLMSRMLRLTRQVARIYIPGDDPRDDNGGTGFLVGPDLLLTNYHVVEELWTTKDLPSKVLCFLDDRLELDGSRSPTTTVTLAPSWAVAHRKIAAADYHPDDENASPDPSDLDYALLRLASPIGGERLNETTRGWVDLSEINPSANFKCPDSGPCSVLQHPATQDNNRPLQEPLKIAMGTFTAPNRNGTRVRYEVDTLPGSSGAIVTDEQLRPVALHQNRGAMKSRDSDRVKYNQGIPLQRIVASLSPEIRELLGLPVKTPTP